jgi:hypothetical protein
MRRKKIRLLIMAVAGFALLSLSTIGSRAQSPTQSPKAEAQPLGAITGRVVNSAGEPLPGASVFLSALGMVAQPRSVTADAAGSFSMNGLDPGSYYVAASAPGYTVEGPVTELEPRRWFHPGDSLTLTLIKGGVITGTVTNSNNSPVINVSVRAFRIRDGNGQPLPAGSQPRERFTDDRGVYRMYGLTPGTYIISAGGSGRNFGFGGSQYENDAPTYSPSATRDTAVEIVVRSGEESNADIQYRGEPGHSISGAVTGFTQTQSMLPSNALIYLTDVRSRTTVMAGGASAFNNYSFSFYGVADGEYELFVQRYSPNNDDSAASEPRRVKVHGADLTGVNLTLVPLAAISGRVVLESSPPADCVKRRSTALAETVIAARRFSPETKSPARPDAREPNQTPEAPINQVNQTADAVVNSKGEFIVRNLHPGSYRINPQLAGSGWYIRSIALGTTPPKPSDPNVARDGLALKSGQRIGGLNIVITEGAGHLRGHVTTTEGQRPPAGLRVYLVPADREQAENVLRFFESAVEADASFVISNIAPGNYWIIARLPDDADAAKVKPIRHETSLRTRVLHEAGILKKEIAFKPCQRATDFELPYSISPAKQ